MRFNAKSWIGVSMYLQSAQFNLARSKKKALWNSLADDASLVTSAASRVHESVGKGNCGVVVSH